MMSLTCGIFKNIANLGREEQKRKNKKRRLTDTENKLAVTSEEKEGEGQYRNRGEMVTMRLYEIMYVKLENFKE